MHSPKNWWKICEDISKLSMKVSFPLPSPQFGYLIKKSLIIPDVIGLPSENDVWRESETNHRFFAIIFDLSRNQSSIPENLRYKIRTKSNKFYTDKQYSRNLHSIAHKSLYFFFKFLGFLRIPGFLWILKNFWISGIFAIPGSLNDI